MNMKFPTKTPFELAGMSIGMGILGEEFGSEGLKEGGIVAGKFIPAAINISMGGMLINQLRDIQQEVNKNALRKEKKEK